MSQSMIKENMKQLQYATQLADYLNENDNVTLKEAVARFDRLTKENKNQFAINPPRFLRWDFSILARSKSSCGPRTRYLAYGV